MMIVPMLMSCATQEVGCFTGELVSTEVELDDDHVGFSARDVGELVGAQSFTSAAWREGGGSSAVSLSLTGPTAAVVQTRDWSGEDDSENPRCSFAWEEALDVGFDLALDVDGGGIVAAGAVVLTAWGDLDDADETYWGDASAYDSLELADWYLSAFEGAMASVVPAELDAEWAAAVDASVDPGFTPDGYAIGWAGSVAEPYALIGVYAWTNPNRLSFAHGDRAFLEP